MIRGTPYPAGMAKIGEQVRFGGGSAQVLCSTGNTTTFQWKHGISLDASATVTVAYATTKQRGEGLMSVFLLVPFLSLTGIYNPQVMHHNRCIAEPGSFDALYCVAAAPATPPHHTHR